MAKKQAKEVVGTLTDAWTEQKSRLAELSSEQVAADIALIEAQRAHDAASRALRIAQTRKNLAERKLIEARAALGAE